MTRTVLLATSLLACAVWLPAQTAPTSSESSHAAAGGNSAQVAPHRSQSRADNARNPSRTTIQGCLTASGTDYLLTDASGTQYQLRGALVGLSSSVNSQIEVTGTSMGTNTASPGAQAETSPAASKPQIFQVSSIKKLAPTCSTVK
jgi:hypothetical protein